MGKNKNRNKNRQSIGKLDTRSQTSDIQPTTSPRASGTASPSSAFSETSSLKWRKPFGTSDTTTTPYSVKNDQTKSWLSNKKRDSVMSNNWRDSQTRVGPTLDPARARRWRIRPSCWWPCQACKYIRGFLLAVIRAFQGPRGLDLILTTGLALTAMFAAYVGLDLVLSLVKGAAAQDITSVPDCSVVYVTIPGPVITVSLIGVSPFNPARGTYYFSVVNGTTEWLNSIAPPSRLSTLITKTPEITPIISSLPLSPSPSATLPNAPTTPGVPPPAPPPPPSVTTITTTFYSGNTLTTIIMTSQLRGNGPSVPQSTSAITAPLPPPPSIPLSPSTSPTRIGQPLRPYPTPTTPTALRTSNVPSGGPVPSSLTPGEPSSVVGAPSSLRP
ncbi:hypothetical protein EK21DRAFT_111448 [Setomelanomma holmii]|uniref:Uncharacterized protein n=1 Tax=Setomelanomma holmii TaxID=210430 RepID=A0A9P4HAN6_9PLEO|nr:hypothetical protein EK21DRAFT_111448 [Setomelanomma holmii]